MDEGQHLRPYKRLMVDVTASKAGLEKALAFANDLFNALESVGHRVVISTPADHFARSRIKYKLGKLVSVSRSFGFFTHIASMTPCCMSGQV